MKNICIALLTALAVLHQSAAGEDRLNVRGETPLFPSGIYLGIKIEEFVLLRPSAIIAGNFYSKDANEKTDEKEKVLYIESDMSSLNRKAIVYQFESGICSAISFEEYYPSTEYSIAREKAVNTFMNRYGTDFKKYLLETKEPFGKQKIDLSQRKSPTLVWSDNDYYMLLTLMPDEWVSRDGIGKIKIIAADEHSLERIKLSPAKKSFPMDIEQAISRAKNMYLHASKETSITKSNMQ